MLSVLDGFGVLTQLRRRRQSPVSCLRGGWQQQGSHPGPGRGADDYFCPSPSSRRVLARTSSGLRRTGSHDSGRRGCLEHWTHSLELKPCPPRGVECGCALVNLTEMEFDLLGCSSLSRPRGVALRDHSGAFEREATPYDTRFPPPSFLPSPLRSFPSPPRRSHKPSSQKA